MSDRRTWPPTTSTVRVASAPARSSSWLATMIVAPDRGRLAQRRVEFVAGVGVEAGVRLVEQPEFGPPGDQARQRRPPALARRQPPDRHVDQPAGDAQSLHGRVDLVRDAPTVAPQKFTFSRTLRSRYSPFWWPSRPTRRRTASRST